MVARVSIAMGSQFTFTSSLFSFHKFSALFHKFSVLISQVICSHFTKIFTISSPKGSHGSQRFHSSLCPLSILAPQVPWTHDALLQFASNMQSLLLSTSVPPCCLFLLLRFLFSSYFFLSFFLLLRRFLFFVLQFCSFFLLLFCFLFP